MNREVVTKLPCGGKIRLNFYRTPPSVGIDKVAVVCLPEVYCSKGYAQVKRCAWIERLRKFYANAAALDVGLVHGDKDAGVVEAKVSYGDGVIRHVRYGENSGIVICGRDIFQDRQLLAATFEERNDVFEKCVNVKTWHSGIITFFRRLFGRKERQA